MGDRQQAAPLAGTSSVELVTTESPTRRASSGSLDSAHSHSRSAPSRRSGTAPARHRGCRRGSGRILTSAALRLARRPRKLRPPARGESVPPAMRRRQGPNLSPRSRHPRLGDWRPGGVSLTPLSRSGSVRSPSGASGRNQRGAAGRLQSCRRDRASRARRTAVRLVARTQPEDEPVGRRGAGDHGRAGATEDRRRPEPLLPAHSGTAEHDPHECRRRPAVRLLEARRRHEPEAHADKPWPGAGRRGPIRQAAPSQCDGPATARSWSARGRRLRASPSSRRLRAGPLAWRRPWVRALARCTAARDG